MLNNEVYFFNTITWYNRQSTLIVDKSLIAIKSEIPVSIIFIISTPHLMRGTKDK